MLIIVSKEKSKFLYLDVYARMHCILYLIRPNRGLRYERMLDPPRGPPPQAEPKPFWSSLQKNKFSKQICEEKVILYFFVESVWYFRLISKYLANNEKTKNYQADPWIRRRFAGRGPFRPKLCEVRNSFDRRGSPIQAKRSRRVPRRRHWWRWFPEKIMKEKNVSRTAILC